MGLAGPTLTLFLKTLKETKPQKIISLGVPKLVGLADPKKVLKKANATLFTMDAANWEGCDFVHDLNYPVPEEFWNSADMVIDPGTIEHVFNTYEAMMSVHRMLRVGGIAFHHSPLNWINHGYHNFSPCLFIEWYETNNYYVEVFLRDGCGKSVPWNPDPKVTTILPKRSVMDIVAVKKKETEEPVIPNQRRYTGGNWQFAG